MRKDFDLELKRLLKSDDSTAVPEKISKGIEHTFEKIKSRNRIGYFIKMIAIAATLILTTVFSFNAALPALAENFPIISRILGENSMFNKNYSETKYAHFNNLSGVQNYAIAVDKTVGNVSVKELAYDGVAFYSIYEVIGLSLDDIYETRINSSIFVDDTEFTAGVFIPEELEEKKVRITQIYPIPGEERIPEEFLLTIKFKDSNELVNGLEVELILNKEQLLSSVKTLEINEEIRLGPDNAKILSLTQSDVYASLTIEHSNYKPNHYNYVLFDDNGNELQQVDMGRLSKKGLKTINTRVYKTTKNTNIDRILIIEANPTNYKTLNTFSPEMLKSQTFVDLTDLPVSIPVGEEKEVIVSSFDENNEAYRVILKSKNLSINSFISLGGVSLYDTTKNKHKNDSYNIAFAEPLGNNEYLLTFYKSNDINFENAVISIGNYDDLINELHVLKRK